MLKVKAKEFDYYQLSESGQAFRMMSDGSCFSMEKACRVLSLNDGFTIECPEEDNNFWINYFDLKTDYGSFIKSIDPSDEYLTAAADFGKGIRILRQDPWEMLITYIISQRRSIPSIKTCVERICNKWGKPIRGFKGYKSFPTPKQLSKASMEELLECGLGYRAEYVWLATQAVVTGQLDLDALVGKPYQQVMDELLPLKGVGVKVANCVALFGFHCIEAFPVDVWIARVEEQHYGGHFPVEKYTGYAGVLQQYMFFFARKA